MTLLLKDIKKRIDFGNYQITVGLNYLQKTLDTYIEEDRLQMYPDFQRGHIWTEEQQIAFCEFIVSGGKCPPILFNHPTMMEGEGGNMVLVDGLQRITALVKMMNNDLKIFGHYINEYEDRLITFRRLKILIYINELKTREQVLEWYLQLNDGGTQHSKEEINRVKMLYDKEKMEK